jgi:hypothetical protein
MLAPSWIFICAPLTERTLVLIWNAGIERISNSKAPGIEEMAELMDFAWFVLSVPELEIVLIAMTTPPLETSMNVTPVLIVV